MPSPLYITDSFFLIHNQVRLRLQLQPLHLSLSHSSVRFLLGFVRDQAAAEPARDAQAHAQIDAQTVTDSQSSSDAQSASDAQSSCDAQSVWDAQSVADAQPVLWLCAVQPLYLHVDHVARIPLLDETLSSTNMVEVIPLYDRTSLPLPLSSNFPPPPSPPLTPPLPQGGPTLRGTPRLWPPRALRHVLPRAPRGGSCPLVAAAHRTAAPVPRGIGPLPSATPRGRRTVGVTHGATATLAVEGAPVWRHQVRRRSRCRGARSY